MEKIFENVNLDGLLERVSAITHEVKIVSHCNKRAEILRGFFESNNIRADILPNDIVPMDSWVYIVADETPARDYSWQAGSCMFDMFNVIPAQDSEKWAFDFDAGIWELITPNYQLPTWMVSFFDDTVIHIWPELAAMQDKIHTLFASANGDHPVDHIPTHVYIEDIKKAFAAGKTKIIMYNGDETLQGLGLFKTQRIAEYFKDYVPPNTFFYVTAGITAKDFYDKWHSDLNWDYYVHMMSSYRFEIIFKKDFVTQPDEVKTILSEEYIPRKRSKDFVCFNRVPRWHRIDLLGRVHEKGLLDRAYYSFRPDESMVHIMTYEGSGAPDAKYGTVAKRYREVEPLLPLEINRTDERDNPVDLNVDDVFWHRESMFSVVCETLFHAPESHAYNGLQHYGALFLSEKIYKPFIYKHPFVMVAQPLMLAELRKCGYKTFSPYIDETYDLIQDDNLRMAAIVDEIERLCNLSDSEKIEFEKNVAEIVEHNHRWLLTDKDLTTNNVIPYFFDSND